MNEILVGSKYSRAAIAEMFGDNHRTYMPKVNGQVVCLCVREDLNPDAPLVILVGKDGDVEDRAQIFLKQDWTIPLFLKKVGSGDCEWEYLGKFKAVSVTEDSEKLERWSFIANRKVLFALNLEREVKVMP